jgi:hypothetical protein
MMGHWIPVAVIGGENVYHKPRHTRIAFPHRQPVVEKRQIVRDFKRR